MSSQRGKTVGAMRSRWGHHLWIGRLQFNWFRRRRDWWWGVEDIDGLLSLYAGPLEIQWQRRVR